MRQHLILYLTTLGLVLSILPGGLAANNTFDAADFSGGAARISDVSVIAEDDFDGQAAGRHAAAPEIRGGYFASAFVDLSRQSVVEVGDRLEVTMIDRTGEIASEVFLYTVTPEVLPQAVLSITLTEVGKPRQSVLLQNYPNPFNPETWIPYQLHFPAQAAIHIYDTDGNLVGTLDLGQRNRGFYRSRTRAAYWDGRNASGEPVASGVYFYQLRANDFSATRRMVIMK